MNYKNLNNCPNRVLGAMDANKRNHYGTKAMTFSKFNDYLNLIKTARTAQNNFHDSESSMNFKKVGNWALKTLETIFEDTEQNIKRWLCNDLCLFNCRKTGNMFSIRVAPKAESLYLFLVFCYQDRNEIEISDDLIIALIPDIEANDEEFLRDLQT